MRYDQHVPPHVVMPPHEVRDRAKLATIVADMEARGWQGRPLLLVACAEGWQAVTGSHRLAAAQEAGLATVPALCIEPCDLSFDAWVEWSECAAYFDDEGKAEWMSGTALTDATALLLEEIAANEEGR